jgi:hypothetical protein
MKKTLLWCCVAIGALGLVARGDADELEQSLSVPIPILVRIEGYIGTKPADYDNLADWLLSCLGKEYPFQVTKIDVLQGDVSYMDIVENARPYHLTYYLRGPDQFLKAFVATPPGERMAFSAYLRTGSRQANITQLESAHELAPTAPAGQAKGCS